MITNNYLNSNATPPRWNYDTFGYGFDITFLSRVEIFYDCVIFNYKWAHDGKERANQINQDRHFGGRILLLKEGEFNKKWIPSFVVGCSDPTAAGIKIGDYTSTSGNFNKYYAMVSKSFTTSIGLFRAHGGYVFNLHTKEDDEHWLLNGPVVAVTWVPVWLENRWFRPKIILEYDALTPNIGIIADIWDNRFEAMLELQNFKWFSFGLRFRLKLSGSEN